MPREQYTYEVVHADPGNREWEGEGLDAQEAKEVHEDFLSTNPLTSNYHLSQTVKSLGIQKPKWTREGVYWMLVQPLPSFTHRFFIKVEKTESIRRSTDWLDGLRGVASLFVFFFHYLEQPFKGFTDHGYGEDEHWNILQLPFLRIFFSGAAMVAIFYVISGYVLSRRAVLAMRNQEWAKLNASLTSLAFRRGPRLFLPSIAASFLCYLAVILGLLPVQKDGQPWTIGQETIKYLRFLHFDLFRLWTWETSFGWYGTKLWTIPVEFRCSMALFCSILIVARCWNPVRFAIEAVFVIYLFYVDRWDVALFIGGMVNAEINIIYAERHSHTQPLDKKPKTYWRIWSSVTPAKVALCVILFLGVFLTGCPRYDAVHTPGYHSPALIFHPDNEELSRRFWLAQGALMIVFSISFLTPVQAFFSTRIARYLGKISYSLYLVHPLTNRTLRYWLWDILWKIIPRNVTHNEQFRLEGGWLIATIIYFPLVFWIADVFNRAVDLPIVSFTRWIEKKCFKG